MWVSFSPDMAHCKNKKGTYKSSNLSENHVPFPWALAVWAILTQGALGHTYDMDGAGDKRPYMQGLATSHGSWSIHGEQ